MIKNIKLIKEMDELSSYLDILKDNLINITNSQLKALQECIEQEIKTATNTEELSYITDLVYKSLKDIITNSKIDMDAPLEDDNIKESIVPTGSTANLEDLAIKNYMDRNRIIPNEDLTPLSKMFAIDSFGNKIYDDDNDSKDKKDKKDSKDSKEVPLDSVYVIDLNKLKAEDDLVNSSDLDIPENSMNLDDVDSVDNDEPVVLDNEKKDDLTTAISSIEYSQNVIDNQIDDIKDNLDITTPDLDNGNLDSIMSSTSIDPLSELSNAQIEPSILDD